MEEARKKGLAHDGKLLAIVILLIVLMYGMVWCLLSSSNRTVKNAISGLNSNNPKTK
jgi:hypothetical protein